MDDQVLPGGTGPAGNGPAGDDQAEDAQAGASRHVVDAGAGAPATGAPATGAPATGAPGTGDPRVDAALRLLDRLPDLPVGEHAPVFERVHAELTEVLRDTDPDSAGTGG